jgi:hypothetical protein
VFLLPIQIVLLQAKAPCGQGGKDCPWCLLVSLIVSLFNRWSIAITVGDSLNLSRFKTPLQGTGSHRELDQLVDPSWEMVRDGTVTFSAVRLLMLTAQRRGLNASSRSGLASETLPYGDRCVSVRSSYSKAPYGDKNSPAARMATVLRAPDRRPSRQGPDRTAAWRQEAHRKQQSAHHLRMLCAEKYQNSSTRCESLI